MKKLLCLVLVLSLAVLGAATAFADDLISFEPEIVNDQPSSQGEKTPPPPPPASPSGSSEADIDIPMVSLNQGNGGSGSSNDSGSSNGSGGSGNHNGGNASDGGSSDPQAPASDDGQNTGDELSPIEQLMQNAADASNGSSGSGSSEDVTIITDDQVPLGSGNINENLPQLNLGLPTDEGIGEDEIAGFESASDAMHSLRIRSSVTPGSVVKPGDRVELTAIPMGFMGVNYKIQWQMAQTDADGNVGPYRNIPGAFGAKYVIVFTEENISNHWRAAIKVID